MKEVLQIPAMEVQSIRDYTKAYSPTVLKLPNGLGSARLYRPERGVAELRNFDVPHDHLWQEGCAELLFDVAVWVAGEQGNQFLSAVVRDARLARLFGRFEEEGQTLSIIGRREKDDPFVVLDTVEEVSAALEDANLAPDRNEGSNPNMAGFTIKVALPQLAAYPD